MPMISSTAEFHAVIGAAVSAAFREVMDKAYKELQNVMRSEVYGAYSPTDYARTEGLLTSWKKQVGGLEAELWFEPSMLALNPSEWQHSSKYDGGDTRSAILDIIAGGYRAMNANTGKPIPARPAWDVFIKRCDNNMDEWVRAALIHQGLPVV